MSLRARLLRLLERRGCMGVAEAAALLRATPSEVLEAAEKLGGAVEVLEGRLCLRRHSRGDGGGGAGVDVRLLPGGLAVLVSACSGEPVACARRAAARARRLAAGGCGGLKGCRQVVPVVVRGRRRGVRLVEGVPVVGLEGLDELLEMLAGGWRPLGLRVYRPGDAAV